MPCSDDEFEVTLTVISQLFGSGTPTLTLSRYTTAQTKLVADNLHCPRFAPVRVCSTGWDILGGSRIQVTLDLEVSWVRLRSISCDPYRRGRMMVGSTLRRALCKVKKMVGGVPEISRMWRRWVPRSTRRTFTTTIRDPDTR